MAVRAATYAEIKQQYGTNVEALWHELAVAVRCIEMLLRTFDRPDIPKDALEKANAVLQEAASKSTLEFGRGETEDVN